MTVRVVIGDCRAVMAEMNAESVDAIVTDPPAGIAFMGREWDHDKGGRDAWVAWLTEVLAECLRVAKPGAHAFVWALPRTSGWTHRALEDAGWEVRDCVTHLFGSGFPKSLDVGKAMDKAAGVEREVVGKRVRLGDAKAYPYNPTSAIYGTDNADADTGHRPPITAPATDLARQWDGWGTALKPAAEFWYLARKPLIGTVAQTVERYGTGAINVDGCRIGEGGGTTKGNPPKGASNGIYGDGINGACDIVDIGKGRWPPNVCLDEAAARALDAAVGERKSGWRNVDAHKGGDGIARNFGASGITGPHYTDTGGPSRFMYVAKASRAERNAGLAGMPERNASVMVGRNADARPNHRGLDGDGTFVTARNHHPTVKPLALMRWLCRLITPPGGLILDPFAGSGSTLVAAVQEGFDAVGIEESEEYVVIARARIAHAIGPLFAAVQVE